MSEMIIVRCPNPVCKKEYREPRAIIGQEYLCTCRTQFKVLPYEDGPEKQSKSCSEIEGEHTGLSVDYYKVPVTNPTTEGVQPYVAECNDIIEALGMNYAQANVFKAIWRIAAAKNLGKHKKGNNSVYDAEKAVFFSARVLTQEKANGNH